MQLRNYRIREDILSSKSAETQSDDQDSMRLKATPRKNLMFELRLVVAPSDSQVTGIITKIKAC